MDNQSAALTKSTSHVTSQVKSRSVSDRAWPKVSVSTVGHLSVGVVGNALTAGPKGEVVSVGGYTGQVSITSVDKLLPTNQHLATLPNPSHDNAAGFLGTDLYVFGGGQSASYNTLIVVRNHQATVATTLARPLSDAISVPYTWHRQHGLLLLGGYDGSTFRPDVVFVRMVKGQRQWTTLFNLPVGLRYPAVAINGSQVVVAGGQAPTGLSSAVYAWEPGQKQMKRVATLPKPMDKAAAFADGPYAIVAGGLDASGNPTNAILAIKLANGQIRHVGKLPTPLGDMGFTQVGSVGYIAGGMKSADETNTNTSVYRVKW